MFVAAPVGEIYRLHFRSWLISSAPTTTAWAGWWRQASGPLEFLAFVLSVGSCAIGFRRSLTGAWLTTAARVGCAFVLGLVTEWWRNGVQDGSARDIDVVPNHSVGLLVAALAVPVVFAVVDLRRPLEE